MCTFIIFLNLPIFVTLWIRLIFHVFVQISEKIEEYFEFHEDHLPILNITLFP